MRDPEGSQEGVAEETGEKLTGRGGRIPAHQRFFGGFVGAGSLLYVEGLPLSRLEPVYAQTG